MREDTAGDPMSNRKWSRKDTRELSTQIHEIGIPISPNTVAKILKENHYSLRSNRKSINESNHPDRDLQFRQIAEIKKQFEDQGLPIISVDTKKKETVGNFKNNGKVWCKENRNVFTHDFRSNASALAAPYGLFELLLNRGTVIIGTSSDTAEFAVDSIELWLNEFAWKSYPGMNKMLILADSGGSNGCRPRLWKYKLFQQISLQYGLEIVVCHYPSGASKWNPIEHRLFSYISLEWQGEPLTSLDFMKNKIEATKTRKGLHVNARINQKIYNKGIKVSDEEFKKIHIKWGSELPAWNYTISPN